MEYYKEDEINIEELREAFECSTYVKNELINGTLEELTQLLADYASYELFVNSLLFTLDNEPAFMLINPDFIDKSFKLLQIHRFDNKEICNLVNEVITRINSIKYMDNNEKKDLLAKYICDQEIARGILVRDVDTLAMSIGHDAIVLEELLYGEVSPSDLRTDDLFLISLNYFISEFPEIIKGEAKEKAIAKLEMIKNNCGFFQKGKKVLVKGTENHIKKLEE